MLADRKITFFHAPQTRSLGTLILLEELGAPYEMRLLNMKAGEQRQPAYMAVNPMGKVPAIRDGDTLVTEQCAVFIHLADRFPQAKLAPALDDPLRGAYLRWIVFYASCFEPAIADKAMKRDAPPPGQSGYGDYDTMLKTLAGQLTEGPYLLGERFSAADILWGTALKWTTMFKLVPELPEIVAYIRRHESRPSVVKAAAMDAEFAARHEAAAAKA